MPLREIAPNYRISQWLNDQGVPVEERVFIKTVATKGPYLEQTFMDASILRGGEYVCTYQGEPALGLGAAHLLNAPALSYAAATCFGTDPVTIAITAQVEAELSEYEVEVCSLSSVSQVEARTEWLRLRVSQENEVGNGPELLARIGARYPRLLFCERAVSYITSLSGRERFFNTLVRQLDSLNSSLRSWTTGPFRPGVLWSSESTQTMDNPTLRGMREFRCPDGHYRLMPSHTKIIGENIRIHYLEIERNRTAYIGYIGAHLATSSSSS
jgi:hypothetical protein